MHTLFVSIATILALAIGNGEPAGQEPPEVKAVFKPVKVTVLDRENGKPVPEFSYRASYLAGGRSTELNGGQWAPVASPNGSFEISLPLSCKLSLTINAPDFIGGPMSVERFVVRSDDPDRKVVTRLQRGITVQGTVRDSVTMQPIAGVEVAPYILRPPLLGADKEKQVVTGPDGRYRVRGVDPEDGVSVTHSDYHVDSKFPRDKTTDLEYDVLMSRDPKGEMITIAMRIVDHQDRPISGVAVDRHDEALSDETGRLKLTMSGLGPGIQLRKAGLIEKTLTDDEIRRKLATPEEFKVVMEPLIDLEGRVIGADGQPISAFTIATGASGFSELLPGLIDDWNKVEREIKDRDGRFQLGLSKEGPTWVVVAAEGAAAWEGLVDVKRGGKSLEIRLDPGVAVTARVVVPEALRPHIKAKLVPRRGHTEEMRDPRIEAATTLPTREATLAADGTLRFEHVRPDRYELTIRGRGVSRAHLAIDVPGDGIDLGTLKVDGTTATGRIEGRIWYPQKNWISEGKSGQPWAFAQGFVGEVRFWEDRIDNDVLSLEFYADEDGRFCIDDVPMGRTRIAFPYFVFDMGRSYDWAVLVAEGQTTTINAFDPEGRQNLKVAVAIGDGSKSQYDSGTGLGATRKVDGVTSRIDEETEKPIPRDPRFQAVLDPLSTHPLSYTSREWLKLDASRDLILNDVSTGKYRLRVYDWLGDSDFVGDPLFDQEIVVPPGERPVVNFALGSGCITGKIPNPEASWSREVEVTAIAQGDARLTRRAFCDLTGNFCVRYLPPGTYSVVVHDPDAGFRRVDEIHVAANVVDLGELALSPGATVHGKISFARPARVPDRIVAVDSTGVAVRLELPSHSSHDQFLLKHLWPGQWTVSARSEDEIIATGQTEINGPGPFESSLTTNEK